MAASHGCGPGSILSREVYDTFVSMSIGPDTYIPKIFEIFIEKLCILVSTNRLQNVSQHPILAVKAFYLYT